MIEACHTCCCTKDMRSLQKTSELVTAHKWMSRGTHNDQVLHTFEWFMSRLCCCTQDMRSSKKKWMSHGTQMKESRHTNEYVMAHIWIRHGTPVAAQRTCGLQKTFADHRECVWACHYTHATRNLTWIPPAPLQVLSPGVYVREREREGRGGGEGERIILMQHRI